MFLSMTAVDCFDYRNNRFLLRNNCIITCVIVWLRCTGLAPIIFLYACCSVRSQLSYLVRLTMIFTTTEHTLSVAENTV